MVGGKQVGFDDIDVVCMIELCDVFVCVSECMWILIGCDDMFDVV